MAHSRVHRSTPRDESVRGIIRGGVGGRILPAVRRVGTASELPHLYPIGIVPAAGSATRLQPLEGSKELIRVHGRPVIDFLLDRLARAGVVKGVYLSDRWLDIGTREGLALARAEAVPAS